MVTSIWLVDRFWGLPSDADDGGAVSEDGEEALAGGFGALDAGGKQGGFAESGQWVL